MRIGISLALSVLLAQAVYAEEICTATLGGGSDLTIGKDQVCTISSSTEKVKSTITNDGTLLFDASGAKITFSDSTGLKITSDDRGIISLTRSATIDASSGNTNIFLIEGQDIGIDESRTLTLKAQKITLGGLAKFTSITGRSNNVSSSSSWGITLDSTTELDMQNLELKNIHIGSSTLTTLKNRATTLENAHIVSSVATFTLNSDTSSSSSSPSSSFTLVGESNTISAGTNALKINGTHSFGGNGTLDFVGGVITLGESAQTTLKLSQSPLNEGVQENTILGFQAGDKVVFQNLENTDLSLRIIRGGDGATLHNIKTTFTNGVLQALNTSGKDQVLVIENGNSTLTNAGTITINAGTTTFKGSGVQIYGQAIALQNSGASTLALSTIDDSGEIVLGKANTNSNKDGEVAIQGKSANSTSQTLQLRGTQTTIGGSVTLENLQVTTQAKNAKSSEGMLFSLSGDSTLTLKGVGIVSGIDGSYQDLSFGTSEGTSTLKIETNDSVIKASSLAFTNQTISLANGASGKALNLYSYGNVALSDNNGSGVGNFAFTDTAISNGSSAKLNLYSGKNAKILANNLTLSNLTLTTYAISDNTKNALDLSTAGNNLSIGGSVVVDTQEFLYQDSSGEKTQGVGVDIKISGENSGNLTLKSGTISEKDVFVLGGTLTLDNSKNNTNSANSQFKVELGGCTTENQQVGLLINGGLTAIGKSGSSTTTTLKARDFVFAQGSIVSSIDGTLSFSAVSGSNGIDITQGLTRLFGTSSSSTAKIASGGGTLTLGDVQATGSTEISSATFASSNLEILGLGNSANTLSIKNTSEVSGIQSIDITDANLTISNGSNQNLKLNDSAIITSRGTSTITASTITASDGNSGTGTYSINVESGTLTLKETATAGDKIGALTLGVEGKQGGNLVLSNNTSSTYHDFKALDVASYNNSSILANKYDLSGGRVSLSSSNGELQLIAKDTSDSLKVYGGEITLNSGSIAYYNNSGTQTLGGIELLNATPYSDFKTSIAINSMGTSSIQAKEDGLMIRDVVITSSEGVLTLQGLSASSSLGAVTINNAGGLMATKADGSSVADMKLSSTLTLTANAPYTSSSSPLGGGKFGVLQAKSVTFYGNGGVDSPLIQIQVLDKPLEGEELFTLQEGGQVVVWTTDGITKNNGSSTPITLEDISLDSGGYKSLTLGAELVPDSTITTQVNAIKVTLSVAQSSASELTEGIADNTAKTQMQTILSQGDNQAIIDSILGSSTNPLKVGFAENIIQGNVIVIGNALNYINDTFTSLSESLHLNDRVQTQIALSQSSAIEGRMARHNNPHQSQSELAKFIRTFHNTAYASSDDTLLSQDEAKPSGSGSLWVNYDGGLATGNSNNSTINGISAGYDHTLGSQALLGGFVNYAYGAFDSTYIHNTSHNIGFGLYSRAYFGSNELDLTVSQNIALVTSEVAVGNTTMPSLLNGVMDYNLYRTNLMARYGYTFKVGDEESPYYLKPLVGVNMSYTYQEGAETDAVASVVMNELSLFKLDMSVGMEMRKYINEGTYFFLMPLIERDLYGSSCDVNVGFVDSSNLSYTLDYQSQTSVAIYAGGEGNLTDNLALNGSLGLKVGIEKSEVLTTWSVGLKYKF